MCSPLLPHCLWGLFPYSITPSSPITPWLPWAYWEFPPREVCFPWISSQSILASFFIPQLRDHSGEEWGLLNGLSLRFVCMSRVSSLTLTFTDTLNEMLVYSKEWLSNGIWYQLARFVGMGLRGCLWNTSPHLVPKFQSDLKKCHLHGIWGRSFFLYNYVYICLYNCTNSCMGNNGIKHAHFFFCWIHWVFHCYGWNFSR